MDAIETRCELLAKLPELGERQEKLAADLRIFCFRGYAIYYRNLHDQVRIERVLHGAQQIGQDEFTR